MALESKPRFAPRLVSVKYFARQIYKDRDLPYDCPFVNIGIPVQLFDIGAQRIFLLETIHIEYYPQCLNHLPFDHSCNRFWAFGDSDLDPFDG